MSEERIEKQNCYSMEDVPEIVKNTPGAEKWQEKIDYSNPDNWLSAPEIKEEAVDLFYLYPTCYTPEDGGDQIADIDDEGMRQQAAAVFNEQASVFADYCNLYAPVYRQISGVYALTASEEDNEALMHYASSKDATEALRYYFENFNQGRPVILAGHSQGSETLIFLLADFMAAYPEYYERMVAAYPIGYSVTKAFLNRYPHLKFAENAKDTGVLVSWNTEGPENIGQHNAVVLEGAVSINPINWRRDDGYAAAGENLGGCIDGEIIPEIADAKIDLERGTVITDADIKYAMPSNPLFGPACFHGCDYSLFYNNLRQNGKDRIVEYFRKNAKDIHVECDLSKPCEKFNKLPSNAPSLRMYLKKHVEHKRGSREHRLG